MFVQGTDDPNRDWRGLMIPYCPSKQNSYEVLVDGVSMKFLRARSDIKVSCDIPFIYCLSLTRAAGGLWSLHGLRGLLL